MEASSKLTETKITACHPEGNYTWIRIDGLEKLTQADLESWRASTPHELYRLYEDGEGLIENVEELVKWVSGIPDGNTIVRETTQGDGSPQPHYEPDYADLGLPPIPDSGIVEDIRALRALGFVVGKRDPNMNRAFLGAYMVAEHYEAGTVQDDGEGGEGVWCIVGDDLTALIREAVSFYPYFATTDGEKVRGWLDTDGNIKSEQV